MTLTNLDCIRNFDDKKMAQFLAAVWATGFNNCVVGLIPDHGPSWIANVEDGSVRVARHKENKGIRPFDIGHVFMYNTEWLLQDAEDGMEDLSFDPLIYMVSAIGALDLTDEQIQEGVKRFGLGE